MAWWTFGIDDDEIGDQPANLVEVTLDEFAQARRQAGAPLPTPRAFLEAFARSLALKKLAEGIEEQAGGSTRLVSADGDMADAALLALTDTLVDGLQDCYRRYRGRAARPSELCAVIAFVLRQEPERFLDGAEDWTLRSLKPVAGGRA